MKNKKLTALLLVATLTICLAGCGSADTDSSTEADTTSQEAATAPEATETEADTEATGYVFYYNGVTIYAGQDMSEIEDALGDPVDYFEAESCAFQGMDKTYTYNSVIITTYPDGDKDYVYTIQLKDDTVETAEGVCIGDTTESVVSAYGESETDSDTALVYDKDNCELTFIMDEGVVSDITYAAIVEE